MNELERTSGPGYGNAISPDYCNEEAYSILETNFSSHGLEELMISCKSASQLHLTGFSLLQRMPDKITRTLKMRKEKELIVTLLTFNIVAV